MGDPIEPGREMSLLLKGRKRAPGFRKHLLGEIGCILVVACMTSKVGKDFLVESLNEFGCGRFLAPRRLARQLFVCETHDVLFSLS